MKNLSESKEDSSYLSPKRNSPHDSSIHPSSLPITASAQARAASQRIELEHSSPLKSISKVYKDAAKSITQRCVLMVKPRVNMKAVGAFFFKTFLSLKPGEKKLTSVQLDIGDITVEFFGKLIEEFCELLVGFRELYCMRDIRPIKKIKEEFKPPTVEEADMEVAKEESIKRVMSPDAVESENIGVESPKESGKMVISNQSAVNNMRKSVSSLSPAKAKVAPIFTKIDTYFAENSSKIKAGFGEISVSLFENVANSGRTVVKSEPFVQLVLPPANVSMHKEGDKLSANVLGATFVCTRQASFASQFWMVRFTSFGISNIGLEQNLHDTFGK